MSPRGSAQFGTAGSPAMRAATESSGRDLGLPDMGGPGLAPLVLLKGGGVHAALMVERLWEQICGAALSGV